MKKALIIILALLLCLGPVSSVLADETAGDPGIRKSNGRAVRSVDDVNLYDVVTFGSYPKSDRGGSAEIEWIVVAITDSRLKLLSRYALDSRQYHAANEAVSWESSSLYAWLNGDFRNTAFTAGEQRFLSAPVSLPTIEEARQLPEYIRMTESTAYAISRGADPNLCYWWLSSYNGPQQVSDRGKQWTAYCASAVLDNGRILDPGFQVNYNGKAVRPIVEVNVGGAAPTAAPAVAPASSGDTRSSGGGRAYVKLDGAKLTTTADVRLYDVVTFGSYPQAAYGDPADIEWIVTGIEGTHLRLQSRYALDSKQYHTVNEDVNWQKSSLYAWLNDRFLNAAFTVEEQELLFSPVSLPTKEEVEQLPDAIRICSSTAYAVTQGADSRCYWWLSSYCGPWQVSDRGKQWTAYCACAVLDNGEIADPGFQVNYTGKTIRPAIEVDLGDPADYADPEDEGTRLIGLRKNGEVLTSTAGINLYDVVTFGNYPQSTKGAYAPIEWIVIGVSGNQMTLLARHALDSKPFHNENAGLSWQWCSLNDWLNGTFRSTAFADEERQLILAPLSLPTKEEAARLPESIRICTSTNYALSQGADARCYWWLSTYTGPWQVNDKGRQWTAHCACVVLDNGKIADPGFQVNYTGKTVRPVVIVGF